MQDERILGTRCDRDVLNSLADRRDAEPAIDVTPSRAEIADASLHRSPLTDPGAVEILNYPLPPFASVSVDTSPSSLEEQPREKPREEKSHQRCKSHCSTRARSENSIDPSRGSIIVASSPRLRAEELYTPLLADAAARVTYPPFESFGRSVTVTVVVQANDSRATFVAEHATVVVPTLN